MINNTEKIIIKSSPEEIFSYLLDIEKNYLKWNKDHLEFKILSEDKKFRKGTEFILKENIAGFYAECRGKVIEYIKNEKISWEGNAIYNFYFGLKVKVKQGGTFTLKPMEGGIEFSHNVWGKFPKSIFGKIVEWYFLKILRGDDVVSKHNMAELIHFKEVLEK